MEYRGIEYSVELNEGGRTASGYVKLSVRYTFTYESLERIHKEIKEYIDDYLDSKPKPKKAKRERLVIELTAKEKGGPSMPEETIINSLFSHDECLDGEEWCVKVNPKRKRRVKKIPAEGEEFDLLIADISNDIPRQLIVSEFVKFIIKDIVRRGYCLQKKGKDKNER
jgi:hypothetical protein